MSINSRNCFHATKFSSLKWLYYGVQHSTKNDIAPSYGKIPPLIEKPSGVLALEKLRFRMFNCDMVTVIVKTSRHSCLNIRLTKSIITEPQNIHSSVDPKNRTLSTESHRLIAE